MAKTLKNEKIKRKLCVYITCSKCIIRGKDRYCYIIVVMAAIHAVHRMPLSNGATDNELFQHVQIIM